MACGQQLDAILTGCADGGNERGEALGGKILAEGLVDLAESSGQRSPGIKADAGIRTTDRGQKCGSYPVARNVCQDNRESPIRERFPIEKITSRFVRTVIPSGNLKPANVWPHPGKKRLLNRPGDIQIVLDPGKLPLSFRFVKGRMDMLQDFPGNGSSDDATH